MQELWDRQQKLHKSSGRNLTINKSNVMHREVRHLSQAEDTTSIISGYRMSEVSSYGHFFSAHTCMEHISISLNCSLRCAAAIHFKVVAATDVYIMSLQQS
jgi:hypothetical protein